MTGLLTPSRPPDLRPRGSADRRSPAGHGLPPHPLRRVGTGVLVGALVMLAVAGLDSFAGLRVPGLGALATLPSGSAAAQAPAPPPTPGTCLSWSRPDAADTAVVDCGQPHLFEQAGPVALTDQTALPDDRQWRQLVNERCSPVVLAYLNQKFDPVGRFRVGALKPSAAMWADGDRELRCGLQSASRSGALYPTVGRVAESDQSAVQEPGTCLAIDGRTVGDPVACVGPHAVETVGVVDLAATFPGPFPQVSDQDAVLQPECAKIADTYAGGPDVIKNKKLTVYWDNVTEESWNAGTRKINCNLAALLPDRSGFAPVTGSVTGEVAVGDTVAPAAGSPAPAPVPDGGSAPAPAGGEQPANPSAPAPVAPEPGGY
ncbi:MAG TPA: septum formation family protein [Pseudonocardia sp.]|nr:septum formation family protein [Pseudonocardia sp.]